MPYLAETRVPIPSVDILSWYFDSPQYSLDKPIYIDALDPNRYWTAAQCRSAICKLAAGFKQLGLKHGDTVCIFAYNSIDYPVLVNGIIGFQGVYTGCNPAYTVFELVHHLKTSNAQVVVVEPELMKTCLEATDQLKVPRERVLLFGEKGDSKAGLRSWKSLLQAGEMPWPRFDDEATSTATTAALLYSSGTTGLPKAVMLSHHNLIAQQTLFWEQENAVPWVRRRLMPLPMFHAATAPVCHFGPLRSGDTVYILRRFELETFLWAMERYEITIAAFVPPMVHQILASPLAHRYSLKAIRQAHVGAAPLDKGSQGRLKALLHDETALTQVWGMTETSCVCSSFPLSYGHDESGSVGFMLPGMDVKVCDDDGNDITTANVPGEICVRGPLVTPGYYQNREANRRDWDQEGYFHTGDIGYRNSEKLWYIVDRKKELIKVRGFQVSPSEIEAALMSHPYIIDAAVIGVRAASSSHEEVPRAYVVVRQDVELQERDIASFLRERLARYKQCSGGIVLAKEIPKSASGKKLKRVLIEQALEELGSGVLRARI